MSRSMDATAKKSNRNSNSSNNNNPQFSSSASRGAVQTMELSKEQHVTELQQKTIDLEHRLTVALRDTTHAAAAASGTAASNGAPTNTSSKLNNNTSNTNKMVNQYRTRLCEAFADWILTDAATAHAADAVGRLWRNCFYARIGPARARLGRDQKKLQAVQAAAAAAHPQQHNKHGKLSTTTATSTMSLIAKQEESLQIFLLEGMALYEYLCEKLQCQLVSFLQNETLSPDVASSNEMDDTATLDSERMSTSSKQQQPPLQLTTTTATSPRGIVPCLHRLYIHWGDLCRYSQSYTKAEWAYTMAARLGPGSAHALNQLAVVSQVRHGNSNNSSPPSAAITAYWYARSLGASHEAFPTAASNLLRLWMSNRAWLATQRQKLSGDNAAAAAADAAVVVRLAGNASRLFLAQFVDLQYEILEPYFETTATTTSSGGSTSRVATSTAPSENSFDHHLKQASTGFRELLQSSTLGDTLLCKLVAVMAFTEFSCEKRLEQHQEAAIPSSTGTTAPSNISNQWTASRILTLELGQCLAERVSLTFQGKLKANLTSAPSVRVLLPFLLLLEYVLNNSNRAPTKINESNSYEAVDKQREQYVSVCKSFWMSVVGIFNQIQAVDLSRSQAKESDFTANKTFKEYQELRGFAPFSSFLKDEGAITSDGYVSDAAAFSDLFHNGSDAAAVSGSASVHSNSQATNLSTSSFDDSAQGKKLKYLVSLRPKVFMFSSCNFQVREEPANHFLEIVEITPLLDSPESQRSKPNGSGDSVDHMSIVDNVDQPCGDQESVFEDYDEVDDAILMDDVLIYKQSKAGGPALLVPGALVNNKQTGTPSLPSPVFDTHRMTATVATPPMILPHANVATPPLILPSTSLSTDLMQRDVLESEPINNVSVNQPRIGNSVINQGANIADIPQIGLAVLPPPGFSAMHGSVPDSFSSNTFQSFELFDSSTAPAYIPTIGDSLNLFGGPMSLQTSNPFASDPVPSTVIGSFSVPLCDSAFLLHQGSMSMDGASLLDSGLLNSLFLDDTTCKTQSSNPFAT